MQTKLPLLAGSEMDSGFKRAWATPPNKTSGIVAQILNVDMCTLKSTYELSNLEFANGVSTRREKKLN